MEIPYHFLPYLLIFISFLFILILIKLYKTSGNRRKLPPGPWKLPILGNLHQLIGSLPHHALRTLSRKHGPLMHMSLGEIPVVVVSSPRIAEEIAKTNDVAFANRVELMLPKIVLYNSTDIASAPYGDYWRFMRKLCVLEFLNHKKVRSFHSLMEDEVLHLVESVRVSQAMPVNLSRRILSTECRIICRATVGRVCRVQEPLIAIVKEAVAIGAVFNAADLFPSMRFLHLLSAGSRGRLQSMHVRADRILEDIIRQHQEKRLIGNGDSMEEEDIVDVLLRASERDDLQVAITTDNIKANIFEMFIAGIETSSLVIEWAMSEMMKNPRVLHKAQAEVRAVLQGKERFPKTEIQKLKYLKMVIKETLRLHPPGPLLCPRRCREETRIHGYDIPVGTVVLINVWAIGRDPEFWLEPERFEPERFQDATTDFHGKHFEFIPFGAGRRICPGIAFGLAGVELSLAHLLYHFDWKIPGGISPEEFDMTENFGASNGRKNNLLLTADFLIS
ncbi:premnaspirodiene oxygenase-like [Salvia miltiorrhiza]|uniref:premnaspirodiene oxygenase-like n=1 Tax=Salvia miltiorrhiza TaxID=226208 RepID=UPI0025ACB5DE|nr:premnaspirodiene oxygenase-like [Salvia miltiorrhiza]